VRLVLLTVIAVLLGASQAAPAVHLDPPDLSGLPEGTYVALGDSYASGFGVPPYAEGTDVTGGNTCRRSAGSYAHIVSERTGRTLEMGACSGARTRNFYEANESWGEAAQLDRLGPDTGLVVGYFESDNTAAAMEAMANTDVNTRWKAEMQRYFIQPDGGTPTLLQQYFYLP